MQELFTTGAQGALSRIWAPRRGLFTLCFDAAKRADGLKLVEEREDGKLIMVRRLECCGQAWAVCGTIQDVSGSMECRVEGHRLSPSTALHSRVPVWSWCCEEDDCS